MREGNEDEGKMVQDMRGRRLGEVRGKEDWTEGKKTQTDRRKKRGSKLCDWKGRGESKGKRQVRGMVRFVRGKGRMK